MNYQIYPNKEKTPSRMTRKRARRDVFIKNKTMKKAFRKRRSIQARELRERAESE